MAEEARAAQLIAKGFSLQPLALGQISRCAWELGLLLQPEVEFMVQKAC